VPRSQHRFTVAARAHTGRKHGDGTCGPVTLPNAVAAAPDEVRSDLPNADPIGAFLQVQKTEIALCRLGGIHSHSCCVPQRFRKVYVRDLQWSQSGEQT